MPFLDNVLTHHTLSQPNVLTKLTKMNNIILIGEASLPQQLDSSCGGGDSAFVMPVMTGLENRTAMPAHAAPFTSVKKQRILLQQLGLAGITVYSCGVKLPSKSMTSPLGKLLSFGEVPASANKTSNKMNKLKKKKKV